MTILITGANGQLGNEMRILAAQHPKHTYIFSDVIVPEDSPVAIHPLDITDEAAVCGFVGEHCVDLIVNCAAYTNVDKAEQDEATALRINADAVANLARSGARVIHVSTDYVFSGDEHLPCREDDPVAPRTAYGRTKLAGEQALLAEQPDAIICGCPRFDESAPAARRKGREFSNAWARIVSWNTDIRDVLCGFRIYPLAPCIRLLDSHAYLSPRMGFDTDILVRLLWQGLPLVNKDVRVSYPADGISNFRMVRDNIGISLTYTRLCVGMLLRLPLLLARLAARAFRQRWTASQAGTAAAQRPADSGSGGQAPAGQTEEDA